MPGYRAPSAVTWRCKQSKERMYYRCLRLPIPTGINTVLKNTGDVPFDPEVPWDSQHGYKQQSSS